MAAPYPPNTSVLCSPNLGAGRRTAPGVSDSFTVTPMVRNLPVTG